MWKDFVWTYCKVILLDQSFNLYRTKFQAYDSSFDMNPLKRQKLLQQAIDAKRSGKDRLAMLIAHQIDCLSAEHGSASMRKLLLKLGLNRK